MKYGINIHKGYTGSLRAFLCNVLLVYAAYFVCRVAFVFENWAVYSDTLFDNRLTDLLVGSLMFDTSAILYTNALYALFMLFPLHYKESDLWQKVCRWVFVIVNGLCLSMNLADAVYVKYTGRRTTVTVFSEFRNEDNLGSVFGNELVSHWYLVILGIALIVALWFLYRRPAGSFPQKAKPLGTFSLKGARQWIAYYAVSVLAFVIYIPLTIGGMRGGFTTAVRPITISNANQYVNHPIEAAVLLNTPFSLIRTFNKQTFVIPEYMSQEEMDALYSPVHRHTIATQVQGDTVSAVRPNIVVLIVESFGREYIGAYNELLDGGNYKGYAPFIDSLYSRSMSFDYTFCNGRKSIDGMPSILSSIPMFIEPFFLTPASMNDVSGLAGELGRVGYSSAFFHGAQNGSMGFQAFARTTGFGKYYGRTEFNEDKRFRGDEDFDGTWAIWDDPFLQFYALKMTEMKQPFITSVFTASSHHPYQVPSYYEDILRKTHPEDLKSDANVIHKCIRYTDEALRHFFETASRQPWFSNTIFVFTSDHTNLPDHDEYQTDLGGFGSPILFFDPSGKYFPAGRQHKIAQQIDIMPTILGALGYENEYVAFGKDLMNTPDSLTWAVNYNNGIYQYVKGDRLLQFNGEKTTGLYDIRNDWMQQSNLASQSLSAPVRDKMEQELKAIIQSYMTRMNGNQLKIKK